MPDSELESSGSQPPTWTGHPLPRRTSPANSVTLRHHRLARDASLRASAGSQPANNSNSNSQVASSRRNSSGDSHDTGQSDPKNWFDQSNQNPTATFDHNTMDVDPPFFQKESDSSDGKAYAPKLHAPPPKLTAAQSSSADDYRSVIDDLTVEIQKLKEELRRYKQKGPDMLRKEKLFEIKIHGLPKRKKRELETTLRDFAAGLEGSPNTSSSQHKKSSHATRDRMYSASGGTSKHASSSSGSNNRPADSAYASMSTGANSSGTSLGRPLMSSRSSEQKVENYLRDIPEGLYPRHMVMTEKEKKKLVVRRLEQLFTGKIAGRAIRRPPPTSGGNSASALAPVGTDASAPASGSMVHQPPSLLTTGDGQREPAREARILPHEKQSHCRKKSRSRDNASASNSNEDQTTESGGNGNSSGGTHASGSEPSPPEQRPTRPKDLDPDRAQVPSENMEYIRHLGLVPPELLGTNAKMPEVSPDAEGWVYLNLLCNLAQLHIINVTPDFVRTAVTEISTKFQLSPDGRKIRWRGGTEGSKIPDSSGDNSQRSPETDETDASNKEESRKRRKTVQSTGDEIQSGGSSKNHSKFGPQISASSESFHYKPLFVHQDSSNGETSPDDTLSSFGPVEDSNLGESRWGLSGSGTSNRKKRRHDGAIIYYSGAPFCTDLSGDTGDVSPTTYMLSSGQQDADPTAFARPLPYRSGSGSSLNYRPLSDMDRAAAAMSKMDVDRENTPELTADSGDDSSELDFDTLWTDDQQYIEIHPLEPCGLGGVLPDDHFMVVVTTKRPKGDASKAANSAGHRTRNDEEATDAIIGRLASMSTSSPAPVTSAVSSRSSSPSLEIEYMSGRIKRLAPVPLPPPAIFFPPFSTDGSESEDDEFGSQDDDDELASEGLMSRRANPHQSDDYPDGVDLSSGDEDGEDPDDEPDAQRMYEKADRDHQLKVVQARSNSADSSNSAEAAAGTARGRSKSASAELLRTGGSSAATAGGVDSGFSSDDSS